ncbi:MAG: permease prefix domain 1-containing protein [Verrucomicrobia bacterium]|nr:permease prefix domain 1-containing protein [Verrucomicrobiota bacterium]
MQDLEHKIAAWRARLSAALPGQEETVRELEEHLRDHIDGQIRRGRSADDAFAQGVARLGAPRALAREFARVETGWLGIWRPALVIYAIAAAALLILVGLMGMMMRGGMLDLLAAVANVVLLAGYLALVTAGLVGLCVLVSGWVRAPGERELAAQRRELFRLGMVGTLTMAGALLLHLWRASGIYPYRTWSWAGVEIGMLSVLISLGLLWLAQLRAITDERVRAGLALLGVTAVTMAGFWGAVTVAPYGWLYIAAFLCHGAGVLLHVRLKQATAEERTRLAGG